MRTSTLCVLLFAVNLVLAVDWTITPVTSPITEGNSGTTDFNFTITRDDASIATDIRAFTLNGTASDMDFIEINQNVSFAATEFSQIITVSIVGDVIYETNETFTINLEVTLGDTWTPLTVTILNDEALPTVTITVAAGTIEGNGTILGGAFQPTATIVPFNFTRNSPSEVPCVINWQTSAGTALVGLDFMSKTSSNTILPSATFSTGTVVILGDLIDEPTEGFLIGMLGTGCTVNPTQSIVILDDDAPPFVNITPTASVIEGNSGTPANLLNFLMNVFPVPSGFSIIVNFTLAGSSGTLNADFFLPSGNGVVIPAGASQSNLWVRVTGDTLWEFDDWVALSVAVSNANFVGPSSTVNGTIINDDPIPTLSALDVAYTEGNTDQSRGVTISTGAGASPYGINVTWALFEGTATAGVDYVNETGSTLVTGASGVATINTIIGDTVPEVTNKTFSLMIIDASVDCSGPCPWNITITKSTATVTIIDDDNPYLYITGTTVVEGTTTFITFTVSIQVAQAVDIDFSYTVTGGTATAGSDFVSVAPGNGTIVAGTKSASFNVNLMDDSESEPTETVVFTVTSILSGPARILSPTGLGNILDDSDPFPTLYTYNITVIEGDNGTTMGQVPLTLSFPSGRIINVTYSTRDESAFTPVDYLNSDGWIAFAPGELSQNISVYIVGDTIEELDTSFIVRLTAVSNANFGNYTAGVVISDDDYLITAAVQSDVYEGSPAFNPRFIGLIVVIGVVLIAIIASIVGFFALKRYVS